MAHSPSFPKCPQIRHDQHDPENRHNPQAAHDLPLDAGLPSLTTGIGATVLTLDNTTAKWSGCSGCALHPGGDVRCVLTVAVGGRVRSARPFQPAQPRPPAAPLSGHAPTLGSLTRQGEEGQIGRLDLGSRSRRAEADSGVGQPKQGPPRLRGRLRAWNYRIITRITAFEQVIIQLSA
jgi:hypothetical protein